MRVFWALLFTAFLTACSAEGGRECKIDPSIFCEPFAKWEAEMPPESAAKLKRMTRQDLRKLSFNFGMGVRNDFGLWQDNEVTAFFSSCGVDHPDYMSTPFTLGFIAYLNDRPANMCELGRQSVPPEPPPPPPGWQPNNSFKPKPLRGSA
mgnify:CR=1 FL=1